MPYLGNDSTSSELSSTSSPTCREQRLDGKDCRDLLGKSLFAVDCSIQLKIPFCNFKEGIKVEMSEMQGFGPGWCLSDLISVLS